MLGLRDSFAAFWAKVAQEFVDNPYVIGYELFNEPWAGIQSMHTSYAFYSLLYSTASTLKVTFTRIHFYYYQKLQIRRI